MIRSKSAMTWGMAAGVCVLLSASSAWADKEIHTKVGPWSIDSMVVAQTGVMRRGDDDKTGGRPYCGMLRQGDNSSLQILLSPAKLIEFYVASSQFKVSKGQKYSVTVSVGPRKLKAESDDVYVVNDTSLLLMGFEMNPLLNELRGAKEVVVEGAGQKFTFAMDGAVDASKAMEKCVSDLFGWWN